MLPASVSEYLPAAQSVQTLAPSETEYLPLPQSMQSLASPLPMVFAYFPAGQSSHVDGATAANVVEYLPLEHRVQTDEPFLGL